MSDSGDRVALLKGIRVWLVLFVVCLVLSGATAFPLVHELHWTEDLLRSLSVPEHLPALMDWIERVRQGLDVVDEDYPFLLYGTDWLAFAHLVIAVAFYGPYRDPVRNIWVVEFALIACLRHRSARPDLRTAPRHPLLVVGHRHVLRGLRGDPAVRRPQEDQAAGGAHFACAACHGYLSAASAIRCATGFIDSPFASVELTE